MSNYMINGKLWSGERIDELAGMVPEEFSAKDDDEARRIVKEKFNHVEKPRLFKEIVVEIPYRAPHWH